MSEAMVLTFEAGTGGAGLLSSCPTMAAASAGLPEGAYTTLRTYDGVRLLRLEQHLSRLEESVALQGRPAVVDRPLARAAIRAALAATGHPESRLRLTFAPPRLFVSVEPFLPLPAQAYETGAACVTLDVRRDNPHAKDTRFIATAQDAYRTLPPGVEEGLLVAADGAILEGLSSNFFAVVDGRLRTEGERVLYGITRSLALEVAARVLPVVQLAATRDELPTLEEAFLTSVSRELLPVVAIDGRRVGDGRVGPRTRAIIAAFAATVAREAEPA
jgi:branched-subunit amino acid aminotransferase/4-amino-4-deoxychorismate lyase